MIDYSWVCTTCCSSIFLHRYSSIKKRPNSSSKISSRPDSLIIPKIILLGSNLELAKCQLNLKNASRKIKHSNLLASLIFWPFFVGQRESRGQVMRRYFLCTVLICNQNYVSQSCNRKIPGSGEIEKVPRCTFVYITNIMPMYIRNFAIVMLGIFPRRAFSIDTIKLFCLLFAVCNYILNVQLNFVGQSVLF